MTGSAAAVRRLPLGLIVLAGLLAYHNSFAGVFVRDDLESIVQNPHIRSLWPLAETIQAPPDATSAGRPVVAITVALNFAMGRLDPWGYHAVNLVIHLAAAFVLYGLVRRVLSAGSPAAADADRARGLALAATLLWTVHPLQTESVTYIIQRAESLVSLFLLITLYAAVRSIDAPRPRRWWMLAAASSALGMATKEVMVGAPLLVVILDRALFFSTLRDAWRARRALYLSLAATWVILAACVATNPRPNSAGFAAAVPSAIEYACTQCAVIPYYLRLVCWPYPQLCQRDWPIARAPMEFLPGALLLFALAGATIWGLRRRPALGFWGALFFVVLAPSSSVVPLADFVVEHRMYLPLAGVLVPVVVGMDAVRDFVSRRWERTRGWAYRLGVGLLSVAACALLVLTVRRNLAYQDAGLLWRDFLSVPPMTARGFNRRGMILSEMGRFEEAAASYREAIAREPTQEMPHVNLGSVLFKMGRYDEAEAEFRVAVRMEPGKPAGYERLGTLRLRQGKVEDARTYFEEAVRLEPHSGVANYGLGLILEREGRTEEAIAHFRVAVTGWTGQAAADEHLARLLQRR